jgi:adenine-specific DNA-methyltransferase
MDEIFGADKFKNDIVWQNAPSKSHSKYFGRIKDTILFYSKTPEYTWNKQFTELSEEYKASFKRKDDRGYYVTQPLHSGKPAKNVPVWKGVKPPQGRGWAYKIETLDEFYKQGKIEFSDDGVPRLKRYLDEIEGAAIQDVWSDISPVLNRSNDFLNYPTQKPEALLERIINASSNTNDLIFDCFAGSGTAQAVAMKLGRRFIGADINLGAVQITTKRLLGVGQVLEAQQQQGTLEVDREEPIAYYTGFEVYNVNHYDVFRNPVQAKELLIEALELNPLEKTSLFDGEKDGRMWKIMPVNRISTKEDLNELIAGFDYKAFQKRQQEHPNKPVESITLVCMGHDPDLKATLQGEVKPYKLDVEVVDILRDRSDLQFKRDSEAEIAIEGGALVIKAFYPMNLLGKLSIQQENVEDWREMVESVMIDWNYDGAVLEPKTVDIPGKNDLVQGRYPIPDDAGTIRVKITDLLSESLEMEVPHG